MNLVENKRSSRRANDNYGFALAAQPGQSQGRPPSLTGSQPIPNNGLPTRLLQGKPPSRSAEATTKTGQLPQKQFHASSLAGVEGSAMSMSTLQVHSSRGICASGGNHALCEMPIPLRPGGRLAVG